MIALDPDEFFIREESFSRYGLSWASRIKTMASEIRATRHVLEYQFGFEGVFKMKKTAPRGRPVTVIIVEIISRELGWVRH